MSNVNEDPTNRAQRYIGIITRTLEKQKIRAAGHQVQPENVKKIFDTINRYIDDAQHYLNSGRGTTALASVAYAEGLLDALKFLELSETIT